MNKFTFKIKDELFEDIWFQKVVMQSSEGSYDFAFGFTEDADLLFICEGHIETRNCGQMSDPHVELYDVLHKWFHIDVRSFIQLEKQLGAYDKDFDYETLGE